jgi:hypothetical protein
VKEKKKRFIYRFAEIVLNDLWRAHVRRYPHKHDPKKHGVWVNAVLLALRQLLDKSYRFVVDIVAEMGQVLALLGISKVPHWTTLQKAAKRFNNTRIGAIIAGAVQATKSQRVRAGIDSSGLQSTRASQYYTKVISKDGKTRRKIRRHLKLSTVIDLDHQLPMAFKVRRGPASDHWDAQPLVRQAHRIKPLKSLDADKGYTSEELRELVVEECSAEDRIKVKNPDVPIWRTKGTYLKRAKRRKLRANYRALNETYHSVLKRIMGSTVRATSVKGQNTEIGFKVWACSALRRAIKKVIEGVFYRAVSRVALKS